MTERDTTVAAPAARRPRLVSRHVERVQRVRPEARLGPAAPPPMPPAPAVATTGAPAVVEPLGKDAVATVVPPPAPDVLDLPPLGEQPVVHREPRWPRVRRSVGAWAARHRLSALYLAPSLVLVGLVHGIGLAGYPAAVDDEGTYVAEAWSVALHHALTPYTYWYTHPPFGWIQIAGWGLLTDGFRPSLPAVAMGRQFMLVCFLASAALVFVVARRLGIRRGWATVGVLVFGLSPLAVHYDRMAYLDNVAVVWFLAAFALALSPRRRLWAYAGSGVCLAGAVLSKETILVLAPALVWQAWASAHRKTRAFCVTALLATFGLLIATYPVYAALKGELIPGRGHVSLWSAIAFQLVKRPGSGSVFTAGTQAHNLVAGWLQLDPWLLGMGVAALPVAFYFRRLRPVAAAYLIGLLITLKGGYIPVPYVIALLPFAGLVFAGACDALWERLATLRRGRAHRWVLPTALVAAVAAVLALAAPAWAAGDGHAMTTNDWGPLRHSEAWIEANVPHRDRLLVSDTMWVDLVDNGFHQQLGVVWFYKLGYVNNLDPSVARRLPGGWRDFQYVVSTPSMRGALAVSPGHLVQVRQALAHSTPVATFGSATKRVVVRKIGGGLPPGRRARTAAQVSHHRAKGRARRHTAVHHATTTKLTALREHAPSSHETSPPVRVPATTAGMGNGSTAVRGEPASTSVPAASSASGMSATSTAPPSTASSPSATTPAPPPSPPPTPSPPMPPSTPAPTGGSGSPAQAGTAGHRRAGNDSYGGNAGNGSNGSNGGDRSTRTSGGQAPAPGSGGPSGH